MSVDIRSGSDNAAYLLKVVVLLLVNCLAVVVVAFVVVVDMGGVVTAVRMSLYVLVGVVVTAIISRSESVGVIAGVDTVDLSLLFLPLLLLLGVSTDNAFEIPPYQ